MAKTRALDRFQGACSEVVEHDPAGDLRGFQGVAQHVATHPGRVRAAIEGVMDPQGGAEQFRERGEQARQ